MPNARLMVRFLLVVLCCALPLPGGGGQVSGQELTYQQRVQADAPVLYLSFDEKPGDSIRADGSSAEVTIENVGDVTRAKPGPRPSEYPAFAADNQAVEFNAGKQRLVVRTPAENRELQFRQGDAITIEAWVKPAANLSSAFPYIVGKGRTHNPGFNPHNQNYALRLAGGKGSAPLSFYFVDEDIVKGGSSETNGHRWTSQAGVPLDGDWHHVVLVYEFGKPESIRAYINGKVTAGKWDLAGATTKGPIVDSDELWVGSSMNGHNTYQGGLDEVAIYRQALSAETIAARYRRHAVDYLQQLVEAAAQTQPEQVEVEVHEGISSSRDWKFRPTQQQFVYRTDAFALTDLPHKYNSRGIIDDREGPLLVHVQAKVAFPPGEQELILRSLNAVRLYIDGTLVGENPFMNLNSSAHGTMHPLKPPLHGELSLPAAHQELRIRLQADGKPHHISLLAIAGHKSLPATVGELTLAVRRPTENLGHLVGPALKWEFTDEGWLAFQEKERQHLLEWNSVQRALASRAEQEYWRNRHEQMRTELATRPAVEVPAGDQATGDHPIDRFIAAGLSAHPEVKMSAMIDDTTFLRRATLDLIGTNPSLEQLEAYYADPAEHRRQYLVERLLDHPDWADHWVAYWQDVLAENPGLTKPMLNNSGPFRWYLHEALRDNRSFDRIVTELILMEGSRHQGGTAGFSIASNNDVPMAAKAHVLGTAFLGVEMKCARCHDAPYHELQQRDLFEVAAMLDRKAVAVPKTSSIPLSPEQLASMSVKVTLKPGEKIEPRWPFQSLIEADALADSALIRNAGNSREVLAALVTSHHNRRFAEVVVNRVWKRLLGRGLVEPADDWETGSSSHPELLAWLTEEFLRSGYDLKSLTRLIMSSRLYQRNSLSGDAQGRELFAGPSRRRLTAEQIVDTVFQAVGKELPVERLTYNSDGRQGATTFIDFGRPRKAWEMVAISNERERPSMNLPVAQSIADLMAAYGWRSERQDPLTDRESTATPLQPLALANGAALNRATDISEHSAMVELCVTASTPESLVDQMFLRVLSRQPDATEQQMFVEFLKPGFAERLTEYQQIPSRKVFRSPLTWTAHFDPAASAEGLRQLEVAEQGDVPTQRLHAGWRLRVEDALWVLFNTPEFVFVP